jgi:hypothetical protein
MEVADMSEYDIPTTNIDLSHHIQRHIMMKLRQHGTVAYQQLKPDGVEGNAFNYHLRHLKQREFIEGGNDGYSLTHKGHLVADGFSSPAARLMMRPFAHVSVLVTSGSSLLLYKATRQPLAGIYTIPSGKMRYGESIEDRLQQELARREVHGDYEASFLCMTNFRYMKNGKVIIHRPGALWHVEYTGEKRPGVTPNGASDWYEQAQLASLAPLSGEVGEALGRIASGSHEPIDTAWDIPG